MLFNWPESAYLKQITFKCYYSLSLGEQWSNDSFELQLELNNSLYRDVFFGNTFTDLKYNQDDI